MLQRSRAVQQPCEPIPDVTKPDDHLVADLDDVASGETLDGVVLPREPLRQLKGVSSRAQDVADQVRRRLLQGPSFEAFNTIVLLLQQRLEPVDRGVHEPMKYRERPLAEMLAAVTHAIHQIRDRLRLFPVHADDEMRPDEEADIGIRSCDYGK